MRFDNLKPGDHLTISFSDAEKHPENLLQTSSSQIDFKVVNTNQHSVTIEAIFSDQYEVTHQSQIPDRPRLAPFPILGESLCHPDDEEALSEFLALHQNKHTTFRNYTRECERFLLWVKCKTNNSRMADLTREDFLHYRAFLQDPDSSWCGKRAPRKNRDGFPNPLWRPFTGPLGNVSISLAFDVLDSFISWQVYEGYLPYNAIPIRRQKISRKPSSGINKRKEQLRILTSHDLHIVTTAIELYPRSKKKEKLEYERTRYLIAVFYYLSIPITEIVKSTMGNFINKNGNWFLVISEMDVEERCVAVNQYMLDALKRFRKFLGLNELPESGERVPLFPKDNLLDSYTDRYIYEFIKQALDNAADLVSSSDPMQAKRLRKASPQWIRNTSLDSYRKTEAFSRSPTNKPLQRLF